jgi:polyhydroxyalkanoate synthase
MVATAVEEPVTQERVENAVEAAEVVGGFNRGDALRAAWRVLRGSDGLIRGGGKLGVEAAKVIAGRSEIEPQKGDWRFKDETWRSNPVYHRLMQLYLAWAQGVVDGVDSNNGGDWHETERARFMAEVLTTALAPTNFLPGNPAAIKHAFETGGISLVRGVGNMAHDLRHNRGMPSTINRDDFDVGRDLATSPGAVVYRDDVLEVIQYQPTTPEIHQRPVLIIPPQINKYYFMDLAPGRSFIENAVNEGIPMFTISWRNPTRDQADWNLDTYAAAAERAIDVARDVAGSDDVNTLSLCAGGILTTTVLNHLAANNDERVKTASFGVTLLDFSIPAPIGMFSTGPLLAVAGARSRRAGVLDGPSLSFVFTWMRPNDLVWTYWVNNYLLGKAPPRFDILAWNADATRLPAGLHGQFLDIFANNSLADPGKVVVLDTPVDLSRIKVETYVTGATTDHLTPWKGCYRTTQLLSGPSTFVLSNAGHVASLINPPGNPKAHYFAGPKPESDPDEWFAQAERQQGTWWEHWAKWIKSEDRAGTTRTAPSKLGSRKYPAKESAPGTYIYG